MHASTARTPRLRTHTPAPLAGSAPPPPPPSPLRHTRYENQLNSGGSFQNHTVSDSVNGVYSVSAVDLDDDGDTDILSTSTDFMIEWFENLDGKGGAWQNHTISADYSHGTDLRAVDMDFDGDLDIVAALKDDSSVRWFENLGGGMSWVNHTVTTAMHSPYFCYPIDMDHDGDIDIVMTSQDDDTLSWHENVDGYGKTFINHTIDDAVSQAYAVLAIDMDHDGDNDVLVGSSTDDNAIAWYKWVGALEPSSSPTVQPTTDCVNGTYRSGDACVACGESSPPTPWSTNALISLIALTALASLPASPLATLPPTLNPTYRPPTVPKPYPTLEWGKYSTNKRAPFVTICTLCPSGRYNTAEGMDECYPCSTGKFSTSDGTGCGDW